MEKRIKVVCTFYNIRPYIQECIQSILNQKYTNWYCVMIDNCSTDGTYDLLPHGDKRFIIIRNQTRISPLKCDIDAFELNSESDEITVVLCGDDKLIGNYAFKLINNIYTDNPNILLSHGQYIDSNDKLGNQIEYTQFRFNYLRRLGQCCGENCNDCTFPYDPYLGKGGWDFNCSHLKTFKNLLFHKLKQLDNNYDCFKENGEWINHSADVFYMTPLMELAGLQNIYFNPIPIYWWRIHNNNEVALKVSTDKQPLINKKEKFNGK